jgi:hypothetical protein
MTYDALNRVGRSYSSHWGTPALIVVGGAFVVVGAALIVWDAKEGKKAIERVEERLDPFKEQMRQWEKDLNETFGKQSKPHSCIRQTQREHFRRLGMRVFL